MRKSIIKNLVGADVYARLKILLGAELCCNIQMKCPTEMHGNQYGGWTILHESLSQQSVIYSAGVGQDISFDLDIISKYGVKVHAFDPTPSCVEWLRSQKLPSNFVFHEYGIAATDGNIQMRELPNSRDLSWTILKIPRRDRYVSVAPITVKRLTTIMKDLGHKKIDILKMDIEGAEYSVIEDMLNNGIYVSQLLVEFHHFWPSISPGRTRKSLQHLMKSGYKVFYVDPRKCEFSLARLDGSCM